MFENIIDYPDSVFRGFSAAELEKIAENCFTSKTKNYELLAKVTQYFHCGQICPLLHAVSILEVEAIGVMIDNYHDILLSTLSSSDVLSQLWLVADIYTVEDQLKIQKNQISSLEWSIYEFQIKMINAIRDITKSEIKDINVSNFAFDNVSESLDDFFKNTAAIKETALKISHSIKGNNLDMTRDEKKEKIAKIAKILFKHTSKLTQVDLENYAKVASVAEFNKLLLDKKVDLSNMTLSLPLYEIAAQEPLMKGMNYNSIEDILLMSTYSQNKTQVEVRNIYSNLLNQSKISSDIMHVAALSILKGNDLKIIFDPATAGFYAPIENIIWIGAMEGMFTDESIAIHELGHNAISLLYPYSNMMPFDVSKLNLLKSMQSDNYGYHLNISFIDESQHDINKFFKYELAAKQVFIKAGELLGLESKAFDKYMLSKDVILFLRDNSPIDLFMVKLEEKFGLENNELSRKMAILDAYTASVQKKYEDSCPAPSAKEMLIDNKTCSFEIDSYLKDSLTYKEIKGFVLDIYIPFLIDHFSLNEHRIFFLERISQLVALGKDIYGCPASHETVSYEGVKCNTDAYYQELMVRQAEFDAVNLDKNLLSSFDSLVTCWEEDTSPLVEQLRTEFLSNQKLVDFSYHPE
jgi:hypothetical protein